MPPLDSLPFHWLFLPHLIPWQEGCLYLSRHTDWHKIINKSKRKSFFKLIMSLFRNPKSQKSIPQRTSGKHMQQVPPLLWVNQCPHTFQKDPGGHSTALEHEPSSTDHEKAQWSWGHSSEWNRETERGGGSVASGSALPPKGRKPVREQANAENEMHAHRARSSLHCLLNTKLFHMH